MSTAAKLKVVVVDDEAPARRRILRLLREEPLVEIAGEADSADAAISAIDQHRPDLVFLDVQMPGTDGFGVVERIPPDKMPHIVFVTAHEQFALKAFEVHAFDYLLKPFDERRFREVLHRARMHLEQAGNGFASRLLELVKQLQHDRSFTDRLVVHEKDRSYFVAVRDIRWIESDRNYLLLHCGAKTHTMRGTLESLQTALDPKTFVRINRRNVVRLDAVREMRPWFHGEYRVLLDDATELRWSRRYVAQRPGLLKSL